MDHRPKYKMQNYKTPRIQEKNLDELGYSNEILDTILKAKSMKELIDKQDFIKNKKICFAKGTVKKRKRQVSDWEKISEKDISDKLLLSRA